MGQLLVEIDNHGKFRKGDMLIFNGRQFETVQKDHVLSEIPKLKNKIEVLEENLRILQAAIDYDHGKISKEEYESLCLGVK